jgi:GH25 family lysozyme M1 (1,4-beta-N-acetylmuramidase)
MLYTIDKYYASNNFPELQLQEQVRTVPSWQCEYGAWPIPSPALIFLMPAVI